MSEDARLREAISDAAARAGSVRLLVEPDDTPPHARDSMGEMRWVAEAGDAEYDAHGPDPLTAVTRLAQALYAEVTGATYVAEGWWHPNVKSGQVHEHPERPGGGWSEASHRLCEPVYSRR